MMSLHGDNAATKKRSMKKVRVAVVVDPDGEYWAATEANDLAHGEVVYWIEAELPVPDAPKERTFKATLVEVTDGS